MNSFIVACIALHETGQGKDLWLSIKLPDTPTKAHNLSPVPERSAYPLQNYLCMLFPCSPIG